MELQKQIDDLNKRLKASEAFGELTDAHKAYHRTLTKRDADAFLEMSSTQRDAAVKDHFERVDPVVYKCDDGTEIRKSHGEIAEKMARQNDANSNELAKARDEREQLKFEKAAGEAMAHYPGDVSVRAFILRAIDGAVAKAAKEERDDLRKRAMEVITAGEKALAKRFGRIGKNVPDHESLDDGDPEAELDALAKKHAKENKISFHKAYDAVLKTEEGEALYMEIEKRAGRGDNIVRADVDEYDDDDGDGSDDGEDGDGGEADGEDGEE